MSALLAGLILVPLLDQGLKVLVLRRLSLRFVPLGVLGTLQVVRARVRILRTCPGPCPAALWSAWILAAGALVVVTMLEPGYGWFAGLLLGGSLSHALESSLRGWVCDYVCLRWWPAFNLADVALTIGAIGMGARTWF
jgi:signal peptidase II